MSKTANGSILMLCSVQSHHIQQHQQDKGYNYGSIGTSHIFRNRSVFNFLLNPGPHKGRNFDLSDFIEYV